MREVVEGVFELRIGYVNVHLVLTDDGVVLVDTGLPRRSARIDAALSSLKRTIGDVRTVLLTHHHPDHTGNVADVRTRSGARVIAHAADAPIISGAVATAPPTGLIKIVGKIMGTPEPTKIDQVISVDGSNPLPGFTAVHTPGHTRGHVSYLLDRADGVLFAGDAAAGGRGGQVAGGPKMVSADLAERDRSVAKLAGLDFEHAAFGHGRAISGRAVERFRTYVASL
jgi:glyoxylase-like metal-dependent hydrolase (beta-lactamase superfamily II)